MANSTSAPDRATAGKYRLLERLGRSGTTHLAEDPEAGRRVIVTFLGRDTTAAAARALIGHEHPHLAPVLDAGEEDGRGYLVTEKLEGETLADRLGREGRLPLPEALRVAREAASALAEVHARGLVHRDVCPANFWLEPSGRLRLLGLAPAPAGDGPLLHRLDGPGTPGYQAPEQAAGEAVTPAADLFGLGCVLYEMVTGARAFQGNGPAALARAVVFGEPTPARELNPEAPEALDALITSLLAKLAGGRPPSAADVELLLTRLHDPVAVPPRRAPAVLIFPASARGAYPPPAPERPASQGTVLVSPEPPRGRRWFGDVVAALLLFSGAAGLYFWWKVSHEPPKPPPPAAATEQK
jgi:serine/threonine protein kinase